MMDWLKKILGAFGTVVGITAVLWAVVQFGGLVVHARDHDTITAEYSNQTVHPVYTVPGEIVTMEHIEKITAAINELDQRYKNIEMRLTQIQSAQLQQSEALRRAK